MSKDKFNEENKREHFRIVYPLTCRPRLKIVRRKYEVVDISEKGIKFLHRSGAVLTPGTMIHAEIMFDNGTSMEIDGEILRVNNHILILKLKNSIPFSKIADEQRYIKKKYPQYKFS